jgi:hypothetical protein
MNKVFAAIIAVSIPAALALSLSSCDCGSKQRELSRAVYDMREDMNLARIDYLQDKINRMEMRKAFDCASASGDIVYPDPDHFWVTGTIGAETK